MLAPRPVPGWPEELPEEEVLTSTEVATFLRIEVQTLQKWRREKKGPPPFRVGSRLRYRRTALVAWMQRQEELEREAS